MSDPTSIRRGCCGVCGRVVDVLDSGDHAGMLRLHVDPDAAGQTVLSLRCAGSWQPLSDVAEVVVHREWFRPPTPPPQVVVDRGRLELVEALDGE